MGCGKSKPVDVASGNTVLKSKKSSVDDSKVGVENGKETVQSTKPIDNNNVDNEISKLEHKSDENVKKAVDESNVVVVVPNEIPNVQQENALEKKQDGGVVENKTLEIVVTGEKDDSFENKNQSEHAEEAKSDAENEKEEETLVKEVKEETKQEETLVNEEEEETKDTKQEETLIKEEETKETNDEDNVAKEEETKVMPQEEEAKLEVSHEAAEEEETKEVSQEEETKEPVEKEEFKEKAEEEETKETVQEETVSKEEETNVTKVSTSEGDQQKDVKVDEQIIN